jgi:hypothetical protein
MANKFIQSSRRYSQHTISWAMSYIVMGGGCRVNLLITLLLMCACIATATVAGAEYAKYRDPKQPLSRRISDLLGRMTLAEKIGQMSQIEQANATADIIKKYFIGTPSIHNYFAFWVWSRLNIVNFDQIFMEKY